MSNVHKLVTFFSSFTVLPIDPDDVADQIRSYGVKDAIEFVGVDLEVRVIRGALHHYVRYPALYADRVMCADIYYDRNQSRDWRRLVVVKELFHLLDHHVSKTATQADCERLVDDLATIKVSAPFNTEALQAWGDLLGMYYAVAVLFPIDARDLLIPVLRRDEISLAQIAVLTDLPVKVVALVMSDEWPQMYELVSGSGRKSAA